MLIDEISTSVKKQSSNNDTTEIIVQTPPQLTYTIELLNVMAVATRGKNAITEVMCQSILSAKDFILCYKEAKFMYTYKIALVEFFIDAYLDIEKDVPSSLQEDIWQFVSDLNDEFEAFMNSTSDLGIMHSYERKIKKDLNASNIVGPPIYFEGLFGRYRLKNILEEYIYESVLSCLENIFQLRLVIKNSKGKTCQNSN